MPLKEKAVAICHGCTGKGNDQIRFELGIAALAPHLKVIAPWRIWDISSREEEIAYLEERGLEVPMKKEDSYSRDRNMWHISHEGLDLEDPWNAPHYEKLLKLGVSPEQAPDEPTFITLTFKNGVPTHLNGVETKPSLLLEKLNELGGANGIGIEDIVENRVVGMKSRGVYETPGGTILYKAHDELEHLTLDRETYRYKQEVALQYADLIYNGKWFTPLREALGVLVFFLFLNNNYLSLILLFCFLLHIPRLFYKMFFLFQRYIRLCYNVICYIHIFLVKKVLCYVLMHFFLLSLVLIILQLLGYLW